MTRRLMRVNSPPREPPLSPVGVAVRMKTRSPQTMGNADPAPGIATFHRMFVSSPQRRGGAPELVLPVPFGPRHCGQ